MMYISIAFNRFLGLFTKKRTIQCNNVVCRTIKHNCEASFAFKLLTRVNPFQVLWKVTQVDLKHKNHENSQVIIIYILLELKIVDSYNKMFYFLGLVRFSSTDQKDVTRN